MNENCQKVIPGQDGCSAESTRTRYQEDERESFKEYAFIAMYRHRKKRRYENL